MIETNAWKTLWKDLIETAKGYDDFWKKLQLVNQFFNSIAYVSDFNQFGVVDVWQTLDEFLKREAGDCEDYAIAKFFTLKLIFGTEQDLSLLFCRKVIGGENHMVLIYNYQQLNHRLVLDNETDIIRMWKNRDDLVGIFSFNSTEVFLEDNIRHTRHKTEYGIQKVSKWQNILLKTDLENI